MIASSFAAPDASQPPICLPETPSPQLAVAREVFFVVGVLLALVLGMRVIAQVVAWYGRKLPRAIEPEKNFVPLVAQLLDSGLVIGCGVALLHHFRVDPSRVFQSMAIFALAISLSLKAAIENFWSGYLILFGRPFRPHDRVRLVHILIKDVPLEGEVIAIGKRATTIRLDDGSSLHVPNSDLVNHPVVNLTFPAPNGELAVRVEQPAGVDGAPVSP